MLSALNADGKRIEIEADNYAETKNDVQASQSFNKKEESDERMELKAKYASSVQGCF